MTVALMLAFLWGATVYRLILSVRQPLTVWRTALTIAITMAALSITLWAWRRAIDQATGVVNLTNLLYHCTTLAGLVSALIYVESLRHAVLQLRWVLLHVGLGAATAVTMTVAWIVAPLHDRFHPDLAPLATSPSVALYTAVFYVFMVWALARQAAFCFRQGRRREDPARTVSLMLIGSACGLGALVSSLWALATIVRFSTSSNTTPLSRIGDVLLPAPLIMLSLGILTMLAMPWTLDVVHSFLRLRALRPAWRVLTERYPEVRLRPTRTWGLRAWLETRERRTAIEIEDALRIHRLQQGSEDCHMLSDAALSSRHVGRKN